MRRSAVVDDDFVWGPVISRSCLNYLIMLRSKLGPYLEFLSLLSWANDGIPMSWRIKYRRYGWRLYIFELSVPFLWSHVPNTVRRHCSIGSSKVINIEHVANCKVVQTDVLPQKERIMMHFSAVSRVYWVYYYKTSLNLIISHFILILFFI